MRSSALFVIVSIVVGSVLADYCPLTLPSKYYMLAGVAGDNTQDTYQLYYSSTPSPSVLSGNDGVYLALACQDESKYLSIVNASQISSFGYPTTVAYTSYVHGSGFHDSFKLMSSCVAQVLLNVYQNEDFDTHVDDVDGHCVVIANETTPSFLHLVNCSNTSQLLVNASMSWLETSLTVGTTAFPYAQQWIVDVLVPVPSQQLILATLTLLAAKSNDGMVCSPATQTNGPYPSPEDTGVSTGAAIAITLCVSGVVAFTAFLLYRYYYRRLEYFSMQQNMEDGTSAVNA